MNRIKNYTQSIRDNEPAELDYGTMRVLASIDQEADGLEQRIAYLESINELSEARFRAGEKFAYKCRWCNAVSCRVSICEHEREYQQSIKDYDNAVKEGRDYDMSKV